MLRFSCHRLWKNTCSLQRNLWMASLPTVFILLLSSVMRASGLPSAPVTSFKPTRPLPASSNTRRITKRACMWAWNKTATLQVNIHNTDNQSWLTETFFYYTVIWDAPTVYVLRCTYSICSVLCLQFAAVYNYTAVKAVYTNAAEQGHQKLSLTTVSLKDKLYGLFTCLQFLLSGV